LIHIVTIYHKILFYNKNIINIIDFVVAYANKDIRVV